MTHTSRRHFLSLSGAALLWPVVGRAAALEGLSGAAFGTSWHLTGPAGAPLERLRPAIAALFDEIDRQMSPWRPDSALSKFNRARSGEHELPAETVFVARAALSVARRTAGAFDPTVGPLVARWGFGPIEGSGTPDWHELRAEEGGLSKTRDGITLDLCGIAKGRALDRVGALLRDAGMEGALFDLGGELAALGRHPSGRDWRVAVEHPLGTGPAPAALRLAPGASVATSGVRAQSYRAGQRTYSHIIDPATGAPVDGGLLSVSVVAPDAMTADAWATALFAAGETRGPELAERSGIDALFLTRNGTALGMRRTGAMGEYML